MVKKPKGKWRMCVDFTDLNKACPKDSYPLPRINALVDSTTRHQLLSFMDAFSGYNQIKMKEADQEKMSFVTSERLFCYKVMPFRLKNVGATYQRLMNKMFTHQIGRNVQVYVGDMLVKSLRENDHLNDLQETFDTLRLYNMKLNLSKCVFGVTAGKFLGFMVSQRGIKINPEKIRAIMKLEPQRTVKDVQSLNGKIAALNRFVSKATDKCLPFFHILRKTFEWADKCQQAFKDLKKYLASPPLLSPSKPGEELYLYLAISRATAHTIIVLTDQPLKRAISKPKAARQMALWVIELSEFDIYYRPRTAIKGQAVADFIAEYTQTEDKGADALKQWNIHTDGSSNKQVGGASVVIQTLDGDKIQCMIRLDFPTTNNEAEYEALVAGLDLAKVASAEGMVVHCNSQVITSQISGVYECKSERMKKYLEEVKNRIGSLKVTFVQIPREENKCANRLAKAASAEFMMVPDQIRDTKSARLRQQIAVHNNAFKDFCSELGIRNHYLSPAHPQANGQVKATNRSLLKIIKTRLEGAKGNWPDELPSVLWAYRTIAKTPTGETPFRLAYGSKAVIPAEVGLTSYRVENYNKDKNEEALRLQLDLVDKIRATAEQRLARY
ncbi:uncharacterized protein LOC136064769 [Quercus suber]|uniref:uncharacterized protein LOC136064769 n=1 Tax=Quercus suber TaxID=58331 RepID=UPI0032E02DCE